MSASPFHNIRFIWLFIMAWWLWVVVHAATLVSLGFDLTPAIIDSLVSNLLLAGTVFLIANSIRFYIPEGHRNFYLLILIILMTFIWFTLLRTILLLLPLNVSDYGLFFSKSTPIRLASGFLLLGVASLVFLVWRLMKENQEEEGRQSALEKMAREAELHSLRQQLQPHFLFNSLNSINALVVSDSRQARTMITQLSDYLRGTIRKDEQQWNTLENELRHLELYLNIEKVRFGERLNTRIKVDEEVLQFQIPALLLQPVMENAIKFGLYGVTDNVEIILRAAMLDQELEIIVTNPFEPGSHPGGKGTGFGLQSVTKRLQLLYGKTGLLSTHEQGKIFITRILIPRSNVQSADY